MERYSLVFVYHIRYLNEFIWITLIMFSIVTQIQAF